MLQRHAGREITTRALGMFAGKLRQCACGTPQLSEARCSQQGTYLNGGMVIKEAARQCTAPIRLTRAIVEAIWAPAKHSLSGQLLTEAICQAG